MKLAVFLVMLLVAPAAFACYATNVCDQAYDARVAQASTAYEGYAASLDTNDPERYALALHRFKQGLDGNAALPGTAPNSPEQAVYIAWILQQDGLTSQTRTQLQGFLSNYNFPSTTEGMFLESVATYLTTGAGNLETRLRNDDWGNLVVETDMLSHVLIGLAALYAEANDDSIRKLAEMQLDLLSVRIATTVSAGLPTVGTPAYGTTPLKGYSYLLFSSNPNDIAVTDPALVNSGYCAHTATRSLATSNTLLKDDATAGYLISQKMPGYTIGGTVDVSGNVLDVERKAFIQFNQDPDAFVELSTYTGAASSQNFVSVMDSRTILGKLTYDQCREPHALLAGVETQEMPSGVVFRHGSIYGVVLFEDAAHTLFHERYAPLANEAQLDESTTVAIPSSNGMFAVEILPNNFNCGTDMACIADEVTNRVTLVEQGGQIQYTSTDGTLYTYVPGASTSRSTNGFSPLHTTIGNTDVVQKAGTWSVQALQGSTPHSFSLDFSGATIEEMKAGTAYVCNAASGTTTDAGGQAFIAASMENSLSGDYIIDCGTGSLPNVKSADGLITGACVIEATEKTVGLVYTTDGSIGGLATLLDDVAQYYPYTGSVNPPNPNICDTAFEETSDNDDVAYCGFAKLRASGAGLPSYNDLHIWINGKNRAVFLSTDSNPFTQGYLDGFRDWWRGLFGNTVQGAAADEDFLAAHLAREGGKRVRAILRNDGTATVNATGLSSSIAAVAQENGVSYGANGNTQIVTFTDSSDAEGSLWSRIVRSIRLQPGGSAASFQGTCGGADIDHVPECNNPGEAIATCPGGAGVIRCTSTCRFDNDECVYCIDNDGDGYGANCAAGPDCNDNDASIHPGAEEICDGIDNDCAGGEPAICGTESQATTYTCENGLVDSNCPYVCNVTLINPETEPEGITETRILIDAKIQLDTACSGNWETLSSYVEDANSDKCGRRVYLCGMKEKIVDIADNEEVLTNVKYSMWQDPGDCPAVGVTDVNGWTTTSEVRQTTDTDNSHRANGPLRLCVQKDVKANLAPDEMIENTVLQNIGSGRNPSDFSRECRSEYTKTHHDWYGGSLYCSGLWATCIRDPTSVPDLAPTTSPAYTPCDCGAWYDCIVWNDELQCAAENPGTDCSFTC